MRQAGRRAGRTGITQQASSLSFFSLPLLPARRVYLHSESIEPGTIRDRGRVLSCHGSQRRFLFSSILFIEEGVREAGRETTREGRGRPPRELYEQQGDTDLNEKIRKRETDKNKRRRNRNKQLVIRLPKQLSKHCQIKISPTLYPCGVTSPSRLFFSQENPRCRQKRRGKRRSDVPRVQRRGKVDLARRPRARTGWAGGRWDNFLNHCTFSQEGRSTKNNVKGGG